MTRLRSMALLLLAASAPAFAAEKDPMTAYYSNTWQVTEADGMRRILVNADGTFAIHLPSGKAFAGNWDRADKRVCFRVGADAACFSDITGRILGEAWVGREDGHEDEYRGSLVAGRTHLDHTAK